MSIREIELERILLRKWEVHEHVVSGCFAYFRLYPEDCDDDDAPSMLIQILFNEIERQEPRPYQNGTVYETFIDRKFDSADLLYKGQTFFIDEKIVQQLVGEWDRN